MQLLFSALKIIATPVKVLLNGPLASIVQKVDNTIHWINHGPVDSVIGFPNTHLQDSVLFDG